MSVLLKRSILRRVFVYFALFAGLLVTGAFFVYYQYQSNVPFEVFVGALLLFLVYFLLVYYREIVRPLKRIMDQMKALLTGKKYQKIYTRRMDEIGVIAHFFNEVTASIEKVSLDIKKGKRMMSELEIASQIQADLLPPTSPRVTGLDVVAKTRPAAELGGDNFDFIPVGDNTFIYVGDVTGHGVPAALVMTMVNTLVETFVTMCDSAYDVVVHTNKQLKSRIKSTMFMTMLMMRWHHPTQKMYYVGCGHEHLMIYRHETGKCEVRQSGGIALGMVPDNSQLVKENEIPLDVGDVVILYTDGLTEGRNMAGEQYTLDRLTQAVEKFAARYGPDGIVNHVAKDYARFVQEHLQDDDVTLIAIKYVGVGNENNEGAESTMWTQGLGAGSSTVKSGKSKKKSKKKK